MEEQWTLEKLGGHKYRLHRLWDGTPEMLDWLKKEGYRALSEGNMDYYYDFEEQDEPFNFGVSMSECFQELVSVRRFQNDFSNTLARNNWDVDFGKRLADNGDPIEILLRVINTYGVEFALYQLAANYSKPLAEKAQRMRQELDESGFITWLKENIKPRVPLNTEDILRYNVVPRKFFEDINWQDVFYSSWTLVRENMSSFANWVEANELAMKNPAEVFNEFLLDHSNENNKMYALFYWFAYSPCACHLFTMLNSQEVTVGVKSLIRKVLTDYGSNDEEFAVQLQNLYDGYKTVQGVEINFVPNKYESPSFVFPIDDVTKHLAEDIADDDETGYIGVIHNTRNDPEKLAKVFRYLVNYRYVTANEIDTTIYRFTGKRKPEADALLEIVEWKGKINDALFICKEFYSGNYAKMLSFFTMDIKGQVSKNYSGYANRPTRGIQDLFNDLFLKKSE